MGLDYTEMIMACEEKFGTHIELTESNRLQTVGDLYHYILKRLERQDKRRCAYAATFFRLRRAFMLHADCPRDHLRPAAHVSSFLPWRDRHRVWRRIERESGIYLPELSNWVPEGLIYAVCILIGLPLGFLGALFSGVAASHAYPDLRHQSEVAISIIGATACFGVPAALAYFLHAMSHSRVPAAWTMDSLVTSALKERYEISKSGAQTWDCASVWTALRQVIAERLDVDPILVTPEARFVEDLGAG